MKLILSRLRIFYFTCLISSVSFTQDFQGKAYYQTKTTLDMTQFGGGNRQVSPEQMKRWEARMKSFLEKEFVLTFNREESIYKEEERLEAQSGAGGGWGSTFASSLTSGPRYKNVKDKEVIVDQEFFGKKFLIKDGLKDLQWKMGTETKTIGTYTVFKATATKEVNQLDWRSMRRRRPDDSKKVKDSTKTSDDPMSEIETPKTIEVVAWYTPQIPVNQGPDEYWGLPGLILEINADRTTILCTKVVMNPKERDIIKKPEKGEVVTQEEYTDITTKKMEEMRSSWRGRRRGRN